MSEVLMAEGSAHYDADCRYRVRILKTDFKPGSGDYEDPPEVKNDQHGEFYEVRYGEDKPNEGSGGGIFSAFEDAKSNVDEKCVDVKWDWLKESP